MKHKKIILWGYKLHTHTQSYVYAGYYKAFKALGYETYWLDKDDQFDDNFFEDALIFSEQFAVLNTNIPFKKSSTYAIHHVGNKNNNYCGNPGYKLYMDRVGRLIDIRFNAKKWSCNNYEYNLEHKSNLVKIGSGSYFEKENEYDVFYTRWATDLLPYEINLEDRFLDRKNYAFFGGTVSEEKTPYGYNNLPFVNDFKKACEESSIEFIINCPWKTPKSFEEQRELTKYAYIAPDFRCPLYKEWGWISCRTFKNISYGQLGLTNSKAAFDFFDGNIIYNEDCYNLFYDARPNLKNYDMIKSQMLFVKENHTFINRCDELLAVVNN